MATTINSHGMKPEDLQYLDTPVAPKLTADGSKVTYAVKRIDIAKNRNESRVWCLDLAGQGTPVQMSEDFDDDVPDWAPDGLNLAFLRADPAGSGYARYPQLHIQGSDGMVRRLTDHPLGVQEFAWSVQGAIVYVARVPEPGRYGTDPSVSPRSEEPRLITTYQFRYDDLGYVQDRRLHLFTIDPFADGATPTQLTEGDHDNQSPAWDPAGQRIVFVSSRHDNRDENLARDVFIIQADGSGLQQVTDSRLICFRPGFALEGSEVYFMAHETGGGLDVVQRYCGLWHHDLASAATRRLTSENDIHVDERFNTRITKRQRLVVTPEGVYVESLVRGEIHIIRVTAAGEVETVVQGQRQVAAFDVKAGLLAAIIRDEQSPGELVTIDAARVETVHTSFGQSLREHFEPARLTEVNAQTEDGYPVHGWLMMPPGEGPHPVLMMIHGGPFYQYGWQLFDEAQVCVGAGYAVVLGNPRGSIGYGQEHSRAVIGKVFETEDADVHALLDQALQDPRLDSTRVGVLGGSYAGGMVTWLVGHSDRFKAAVSERAVNDWTTLEATGDIGFYFNERYAGEGAENLRKRSPLTYADRITTPTLIIHSEEDYSTPIEQGMLLFHAMKKSGKAPVRMLLFPGESHMLTSLGQPRHRVSRFHHIINWFNEWL